MFNGTSWFNFVPAGVSDVVKSTGIGRWREQHTEQRWRLLKMATSLTVAVPTNTLRRKRQCVLTSPLEVVMKAPGFTRFCVKTSSGGIRSICHTARSGSAARRALSRPSLLMLLLDHASLPNAIAKSVHFRLKLWFVDPCTPLTRYWRRTRNPEPRLAPCAAVVGGHFVVITGGLNDMQLVQSTAWTRNWAKRRERKERNTG